MIGTEIAQTFDIIIEVGRHRGTDPDQLRTRRSGSVCCYRLVSRWNALDGQRYTELGKHRLDPVAIGVIVATRSDSYRS